MKVELRKITTIQMGYSFRARLESLDSGTVAVIQMKDLTDENCVDCAGLVKVGMKRPKGHHLAKPRDLIFRSRGLTTTSAILTEDPGIAVVAAPLLRIRVTSSRILPEYLHWYINQSPAQTFLSSRSKGTAQKMICKQALESLEVLVPPLHRQKMIIGLAALAEKEQNLLKRLAEKRRQYISTKLMQLTKGE